MARDITQNITIKTSLQDGISKSVKQAATASSTASRKIDKNVRRNILSFKRLTAAVRGFRNTLATIKAAVPGLAALAAVVGGGMGFISAARGASEFASAIAEVSTLVDTSLVDMEALRAGVLDVSNEFGAQKTTVAKGLYQAISSGAVDAAHSIDLLRKAQALATAGVSSTEQAVDILTTVINAYGLEVEDAARITDVLFETVKQGKTTLPELAQGMGRAIPLAATLGVSLEELSAAIAAMTKGGIATDQAIVALRGAMAALISPSEEASSILEAYGIDISKARIESEGLVAVLGDVERKLGDNPQAVAAIFPNIRALTGIFALTGKQANEFRRILVVLEDSLGSMSEALDKQLSDPAFRAKRTINELKNAFLGMGQSAIIAFNAMIERGGGAEKIAEQLAGAGEVLGAVFGALATNIGEALRVLGDFTDGLGGAENLGRVVGKSILLFGEMVALGFGLAVDAIAGFVQDVARMIFDLGRLTEDFLPGGQDFSAQLVGIVGIENYAKLLGEEITELEKVQARFADQAGDIDAIPGMVSRDFESYELATEGAKAYADATEELAQKRALLAGLGALSIVDPNVSDGTEDRLKRFVEAKLELEKAWADLDFDLDGKIKKAATSADYTTFADVGRKTAKLYVDAFQEQIGDLTDMFRPLQVAAKQVFAFFSDEFASAATQEFADGLAKTKLQLEGNAVAILELEQAERRKAAASLVATDKERRWLDDTLAAIDEIEKAELHKAQVTAALRAIEKRERDDLAKQREEEARSAASNELLERQRQQTAEAIQLLRDLGAANARTFEDRLYYERELLKVQRDRQIEQLKGAENFEELSQRIRDAYEIQLEGLDPANLQGFAGYARGAKEALEEFVIYVKDDAAFAFDAMNAALGSFSQGFGRAFVDFASGAKSASAAFTAFAQNFIAQIAQMFAQRATAQFLGLLIGSFGGGIASPSSPFPENFAKGGVVQGGLSDLHAYAQGGPIVRKPHIALVGEGQYNEAVVPLPDGRSIPVDMRGGGSGAQQGASPEVNVTPNITFQIQSLDPRGTVEVLLEPEVQKSLRAALTDSLIAGSDAAFSGAVKGA